MFERADALLHEALARGDPLRREAPPPSAALDLDDVGPPRVAIVQWADGKLVRSLPLGGQLAKA